MIGRRCAIARRIVVGSGGYGRANAGFGEGVAARVSVSRRLEGRKDWYWGSGMSLSL